MPLQKDSEIYRNIEPLIQRQIDAAIAASNGATSLSPNTTAFLKKTGDTITGNIAVSPGVTVDGVDIDVAISALQASAAATKAFAYSGLGLGNTDDGTTYTLTLTSSTYPGAAAAILATTSAGLLGVQGLGIGAAGNASYAIYQTDTAKLNYFEGRMQIGASALSSSNWLRASRYVTDGAAQGSFQFFANRTSTVNQTNYTQVLQFSTDGAIYSGVTDSGYWAGMYAEVLRYQGSDLGTLDGLYGGFFSVGHYGSEARTTNIVNGFKLATYAQGGTIGDIRLLWLTQVGSSATISGSNFGLYADTAAMSHYVQGDFRIGTTSSGGKLHVLSTTEQLRTSYSGAVYATHTVSSAGNLTLATTGANIYTTSHLAHPSYVSQLTNWRISNAGEADFRYIYTDELHAKAFIADLEQALAGGQIISKSVAKIYANFAAPTAGNTANLDVEEFAGFAGFHVFADGDLIRIRQFDRSGGGLKISDIWGTVVYSAQVSGSNPPAQRYVFTRSGTYPGTGSGTISAGVLALDYGTTGNGYLEQNAIDGASGANSPYYQGVTWTTHPKAASPNGLNVKFRLGQLRGLTGNDEYGLYAGTGWTATPNEGNVSQYTTAAPTADDAHRYIIAGQNGVAIYNADFIVYNGTTPVFYIDRINPFMALGSDATAMGYLSGPAGYWVGNDGGLYKFRLGSVSGGALSRGLSWDGSTLRIMGNAYIGNGVGFMCSPLLYCAFDTPPASSVCNFNGHLGQPATITGAPVGTTGRFSGGGAYINSGNYFSYTASGNISLSAGTISFWFKSSWDGNDATNRDILICGAGYFSNGIIRITRTPAQDGGNKIRVLIVDSSGGTHVADYNTPTTGWAATWQHIAITYDKATGQIKFYRNGTLAASAASPSAFTWSSTGASISTTLSYAGDQVYDDLFILDRVLTDDEIASVYGSNSPVIVVGSNYELMLADTSASGYVRANARGLFGYSDTTGAAGTGAFALVTTNSTALGTPFGSVTLNAGDLMLGSASSGSSNLYYDRTNGKIKIRVGTIDKIVANDTGALGIKDDSGNNVLLFSGSVNQILRRVDLATGGSITAGVSFDDVIFDSTGLTLKAPTAYADINSIRWKYSGTAIGKVYTFVTTAASSSTGAMEIYPYSGGTTGNIDLNARSSSNLAARIYLTGTPNSATAGPLMQTRFYNTSGTEIGGNVVSCMTAGTTATITANSAVRYRMHYRLVVRASTGQLATLTGDLGVSANTITTVGSTANDFRVGVAAGGYIYWDRVAGSATYEVTFWAIYI